MSERIGPDGTIHHKSPNAAAMEIIESTAKPKWGRAKGIFSSVRPNWRTPDAVYKALDEEFGFTLDPCGPQGWDGLFRSWEGERVYCNPPYSRDGINQWLSKAREADIAVYLLASRTGSDWWHRYALDADEIRFIRGRLRFDGSPINAPFDSVILVYGKAKP